MKLGLNVGHLGTGVTPADQIELVKEAEVCGFDSVWVAEAYGSDAGTPLAWFAAQTEKIRIASAVFQIPGRTPANCAMTAATLDVLSNGRFTLGLGTSGPQVAEGWHGQPFAHQLQRTREYVEILRKMLGRERVTYDGEIYKLPLPDGPGKPLKLSLTPIQNPIPIYIAAIGPNNTALVGEIADGWLPFLFSPAHISELSKPLAEGAARAGRDVNDIKIAPAGVPVAIGDNVDELRDRMRPMLALYIGGMGSRKKNFYNRIARSYGFDDEAAKIQDLYLDKKYDEAMAAVPAELVDLTTVCGTPDMVRNRLSEYRDAGVDTLTIAPAAATGEERLAIVRQISELV